jgi:ABC-type lipoprotein release transport system permease subunit
MKFLIMISLRNLLRQKRRNILLGTAMAFGVMILVIASSFSHGISDIMFNKIVVHVAGHVNININEGRGRRTNIFRDKERLSRIIKKTAGNDLEDLDEGLGIFLRAIGNGKAENMVLVGVNTGKSITEKQRKEYDESFHMLEGNFSDLRKSGVENPVILSKEKAKILNVKKNDIIRVRFSNVYRQSQSARLTVTGIMSNDNIFMQGVMFVELKNLKALMGYRPWECAAMKLTLKNPRDNAVQVADRLHDALIPGRASIYADISLKGRKVSTTLIPFMGNDEKNKKIISSAFTLLSGKMDDVVSRKGVMVSEKLAAALKAKVGDRITVSYDAKFEKKKASRSYDIKGIYRSNRFTGSDTLYMQETLFYPLYYEDLPNNSTGGNAVFNPSKDAPFYAALGKEWVLLDRTRNTDDLKKKWREIARKKVKAATISVNSMYESASDVLKLEGALNIITLSAVLILFFIIIVGVINTLRMTIRERTREIGTIRSIGMQRKDVRTIFILETFFLTFFSAVAGTILAFLIMKLLSLMTFHVSDNPMGILLVKQHLYFKPTPSGVFRNILLILAISLVTAFFPARRAANLPPAEALRHFE